MVSRSTKKFYLVVGMVFCIFVLIAFIGIKFASKSLQPIFFGIVIAYLFKPMCNTFDSRLHRLFSRKLSHKTAKKLAHILSIILTYVVWLTIIYVLLAAVIPTVIDSVVSFGMSIPSFITYFVDLAYKLAEEYELVAFLINDTLPEWSKELNTKISELLAPVASGAFEVIVNSFTFIFNMFVGFIVSVYLLIGRKKLGAQAKLLSRSVFGKKWSFTILEEIRFADKMFSNYFVGSLIDSAIVGTVCYLSCLVMKTPYSILVSMIVAVTNLIPFFGPWIGLFCAAVIILTQSPIHALTFAIVVWFIQQIDGNIIAPKIHGSQTGLSSFWVLFAILLFGGLFGFLGMIIGVPVFAVIYDICGKLMRYCLERRGESEVIAHYEKEFIDEEKKQLSQGIQKKIKKLKGKGAAISKPGNEFPETIPEPILRTAPTATVSPDDDESEREQARFDSIGSKK